jgi:hypothetical protein
MSVYFDIIKRFYVAVLPGLAIFAISGLWRRSVLALFVAASLLAIFINTYQGLYNPLTAAWNARPNIDEHPELLFDWDHPQWLASKDSLRDRVEKAKSQSE